MSTSSVSAGERGVTTDTTDVSAVMIASFARNGTKGAC